MSNSHLSCQTAEAPSCSLVGQAHGIVGRAVKTLSQAVVSRSCGLDEWLAVLLEVSAPPLLKAGVGMTLYLESKWVLALPLSKLSVSRDLNFLLCKMG